MTLINKIREKSGLAVAIVAVSLGLFIVGSDLMSNRSVLFGDGGNPVIGEIEGNDIRLKEFNEELEIVKRNFELSQGTPPSENQMQNLRQEAWQRLVFKYAYQPQFEKLGIRVTPDEISDMIQGNNIHPGIANSFKDDKGELDKKRLQEFLANIKQGRYGNQMRLSFENYVVGVLEERARNKYENLLSKSYYATSLEAKKEYERQNTKVDVNLLYVPYTSIPDSTIKPTDAQLKEYYNKNKKDYEREANVALEYLTFPVKASNEDRLEVAKEASSLVTQFQQTKNDTAFIEANSDTRNNFLVATPKELPTAISVELAEKGKVFGPLLEKESYKLYKVIDIQKDTALEFARARHILFKVDKNAKPEEKAKAKAQAEKVLAEIKKGADFAEKAREHGSDGTRNRGGDLGWFDQNTMVKPFSDAVFGATTTGLLPKIVETEFGYHIVSITNTKTRNKYVIGVIEKLVQPSDETRERVYRQAGKFARAKNAQEFNELIEKDSTVTKLQALTVPPTARSINNITSPRVREIIRWAYKDETKVGTVSDIFDLEDQFVIVLLTERTEKGIAPFEKVKEDVTRAVIKELKAQKIIEKLKATSGSLDERRQAYGADAAMVVSAQDLSLRDNSVNNIGFAPKLVGKIFSMQKGEVSEPIKEDNGVVIVEVTNIDAALETADYNAYKTQLIDRISASITFKIPQAINELSKVEEQLYKFF